MTKISKLLFIILLLINLVACNKTKIETVKSSDEIYVRKIEKLSDDFIMAADISSIISLENSGVKFYDYDNNEQDIFKTLAQNGINYIRVRVWNDPYDSNGNGYGGGNCDINNALEIGKRANQYGMKLIVDFHYSDFWADPNKQMVPKAWKDLTIEDKAQALYKYTKESLQLLKDNKVDVGIVTLGNENNTGMAGETIWMNIIYHLMASGAKAVREIYPDSLIAVHFTNPESSDAMLNIAKKLDYYELDYDIFSTSYYPFWHGSLDNLHNVLDTIANTYNKKVMVMETSYPYTEEDYDYFGNTISSKSSTHLYPFSIQGQVNSLLDIIETINNTTNGIGICYWEPAWIPVGLNSYEDNLKIWENYGSGWASSYAKEYDPDDAGKYYGGSAVDNQALFDKNGYPLESLKVFALARLGNEIELQIESIDELNLKFNLNDEIILPEKIAANMNDGSSRLVDVTWENYDKNINTQVGIYEVKGNANSQPVICNIEINRQNLIENPSFENDDNKTYVPTSWKVIDYGNEDELYVEDKVSDSIDGSKHYHFWASTDKTISFNLEQELTDIHEGTYEYNISTMGGDCIIISTYIYVKINDEIAYRKDAPLFTTYNDWHTSTISNIEIKDNDKIAIGIHIETFGTNKGAWGKIDNAIFNVCEQEN
ncbi:MAG: glycosyl hydrolase 53 family protein [Erysipelotrichaceae bacterium]|nr:glycosyl hydrolase 53 family protein [Erysipelotrichaceae bacterium]